MNFGLSVLAKALLVVIAQVWLRHLVARRCPESLTDALAVVWATYVVTAPLVLASWPGSALLPLPPISRWWL
ncbi:hypothetical protein A8144_00030 [Mycobacterium leprae 3125609]|nr:hypothetical protein A8144_00030 [Mycobacterium leprae 3125609]OAX72195.1 hypothetical protein A3216_00085 [Mycobacterium leprae 7935681]